MSLSNILVPNTFTLYCETMNVSNDLVVENLDVQNLVTENIVCENLTINNDLVVTNDVLVQGQNLNVLNSDNISIESNNAVNITSNVNIGDIGTNFQLSINGTPFVPPVVNIESGEIDVTWIFYGSTTGRYSPATKIYWTTVEINNLVQVSLTIGNFSTELLTSDGNGEYAQCQVVLPNNLLPDGIIGFPVPTYCEENGDFMGILYIGNPFNELYDGFIRVWLNSLNIGDLFTGNDGAPVNGMRSGVIWSISYVKTL